MEQPRVTEAKDCVLDVSNDDTLCVARMVSRLLTREKALEILEGNTDEKIKWLVLGIPAPAVVRTDIVIVPNEIFEHSEGLDGFQRWTTIQFFIDALFKKMEEEPELCSGTSSVGPD